MNIFAIEHSVQVAKKVCAEVVDVSDVRVLLNVEMVNVITSLNKRLGPRPCQIEQREHHKVAVCQTFLAFPLACRVIPPSLDPLVSLLRT